MISVLDILLFSQLPQYQYYVSQVKQTFQKFALAWGKLPSGGDGGKGKLLRWGTPQYKLYLGICYPKGYGF